MGLAIKSVHKTIQNVEQKFTSNIQNPIHQYTNNIISPNIFFNILFIKNHKIL